MGLYKKATEYLERIKMGTGVKVSHETVAKSEEARRMTREQLFAMLEYGTFVKAKRRQEVKLAEPAVVRNMSNVIVAPIPYTKPMAPKVPLAVEPINKKTENKRLGKLRKLVAGLFLATSLHAVAPTVLGRCDITNVQKQVEVPQTLERDAATKAAVQAEIDQHIVEFQKKMVSSVSEEDRNIIAQMVYGEAGRGADPFEIIHTVLNRRNSNNFGKSLSGIVKQKNQYVGYNAKNPVTPEYRRMVDMVIDEWEANGCKKIDNCDHYYFVTGIAGVCNKFEISGPDWVPRGQKKYAQMQHYCPTATRQAAQYFNEVHSHERNI